MNPRLTLALLAAGFPPPAMSQELNATIIWLFAGAPLLAVLVTMLATVVLRSWRVLFIGFGAIAFWIAWYWVAAQYAEADILFWIPVVAIHIQVAATGSWLCWRLLRRNRT